MAMDHHRWDLARNSGTNPNGFGPHGDNSVPDAGLPRASGGQKPSAEHVNRNAQGITDSKLRASDSHLINRTGRGVTLTSHPTPSNMPFKLVGAGKGYLCMTMGRLMYSQNSSKFDIRQWFSAYTPATPGDEFMNRGGEFAIDIKKSDGKTNLCFGTDGNGVVSSAERYASHIFFGMDGGEKWTGEGDMQNDYALYFTLSQGNPVPTLVYKKMSSMPQSNVIPVAYVMKNGMIIQLLHSDMFIFSEAWDFKLSFFQIDDSNDWYFNVGVGTINGLVPKYESGESLTDSNAKTKIKSGSGNDDEHWVYVKAATNNTEPYVFPDKDKLLVVEEKSPAASGGPSSDNNWAYVPIGYVKFRTEGGKRKIEGYAQVLRTSQNAAAWKVDKDNKQYFFWPVNIIYP